METTVLVKMRSEMRLRHYIFPQRSAAHAHPNTPSLPRPHCTMHLHTQFTRTLNLLLTTQLLRTLTPTVHQGNI